MTIEEDWEIIQAKTFTNWMNNKLASKGYPTIRDVLNDCYNGISLVHLLQSLTGENIFYNVKTVTKYQSLENIKSAIDYLDLHNVKLVNIGAPDLYDKNVKLTLGLIWTIILRFGITGLSVENSNAKKALLTWCQAVTKPYSININDFSNSWKDGLGFNALIHRFRPDLIGDFNEVRSKEASVNVKRAFDIAEKDLGIPKLLDVEDVVDVLRPDEKSIFTYVSEYYNKFSLFENEQILRNKTSDLIKKINWSIRSRNDYEKRASSFLDMIDGYESYTTETASAFNVLLNVISNRKKMARILNDEFLYLKGLKDNIDLTHKTYKLTAYNPPEELCINKLNKGVFSSKINEFKEFEELFKTLTEESKVNIEKKKIEVEKILNILDNKNDLENQLATISREIENLNGKELELLNNLDFILNDKKNFLSSIREVITRRENIQKKAIKLFNDCDNSKTGKIRLEDFVKCLAILGCNIGLALEKNIQTETTNFFTFEKYMESVDQLCIESSNAVQFKKEIEGLNIDTIKDLHLEEEDCDELMKDGCIDVKKVLNELSLNNN